MRISLGILGIVALALLIALQPPPTQSYAVGTPGEGRLPYGFWSAEANTEGAYRWSDGDSRLRFFGYGTTRTIEASIRMIGPHGSRGQETTLQLNAGDLTLLKDASPAGWRTYHLLIPATSPGWQTPELWIGGTVTSGIQGDARGVGVAIGEVRARPIEGLRPLAIAEYAAFAALLMGLIWAGLARVIRSSIALGVSLATGALIALWVRLDPAGAAYFLPPLWGLILLPLGAIAAPWLIAQLAPKLQGRPSWLAGGLVLGLAGALLLRARIWMLPAGVLLLGGALIAVAALVHYGRPPTDDGRAGVGRESVVRRPSSEPVLYWLGIGGCTLLALGLRLVKLDDIPFGLWRDEARHGIVALNILSSPSYRPIYVPEVDIPALLFYLQTISIKILGPTAGAVRVVPALAGGLTTLSIAYLARTIWGRRAGIAAALLLALSAWHIALSRLAFAAVLDPLLSLIALALLWRICDSAMGETMTQGREDVIASHPRALTSSPNGSGQDKRPMSTRRRLIEGAIAGAALGAALYTYHPARLMPLAAALWVALRLRFDWQAWRRALPALAIFVLVAGIVASPLLGYWLGQARDFNQRVGQVSLLDRQSEKRSFSADINRNLELYSLMWHVDGDQNARHNIPGSPMLDPLSGLLFLVGLLLLLADRRPTTSYPLLALLVVGLLPGLLSNGAPHTVRSVDAIAPALLIAAYAVTRIAAVPAAAPAPIRIGVLNLAIASVVAINIWSYFGRVPYDPRVWDAFTYTADSAIGNAIQAEACHGQALVPQTIAEDDVMDYMAYGHSVEPFSTDSLPERFPAGSCVFIPTDMPAAERALVAQAIPRGVTAQVIDRYPGTDQPVFWMYEIP